MLILKQPSKNRWIPPLVLILLLIVAVAAPIRREYSTYLDNGQCISCNHHSILITDVHYGAPMAWLTLSKSVDQTTRITKDSSTTKNTAKLVLDLLSWALILAIYLFFKILANLKSRPAKTS